MGSTMGFTTILVGKLQQEDDEALRMSLEDASWIGKLNYSEEPESIYIFRHSLGIGINNILSIWRTAG